VELGRALCGQPTGQHLRVRDVHLVVKGAWHLLDGLTDEGGQPFGYRHVREV
jgi:hypothetical protein